MDCAFCNQPITKDEAFTRINFFGNGDDNPRNMYRCGWWFIHAKCLNEMVAKSGIEMKHPFPTFEPVEPGQLERDLVKRLAENLANAVDQEIIDDLIKTDGRCVYGPDSILGE